MTLTKRQLHAMYTQPRATSPLNARQRELFQERVEQLQIAGNSFSESVVEARREFGLPVKTLPFNRDNAHCDFCARTGTII